MLRTPSPHIDESLAGYILRLSEKNYYQSPNWILQLAGCRLNRQIQFNHYGDKASLLSQLTGIDEAVLKSLAFRATNQGNIMSYSIYTGATQLCPDCLKESLYSRLLWDSPMSRICPIHRCNLINKCPQCQQLINWSRSGVACCQCGFDFRNALATAANDAQVNFSLYLYGHFGQLECMNTIKGIYQQDNPVFDLTLNQFSRLSRCLGDYVRGYWRHQKSRALSEIVLKEFDSELEELSQDELVFDFFQNWKNNLKKLLRWHKLNLRQGSNQLTTVSSMVDFLVKLATCFPVSCSISILLESYLINFLGQLKIEQTVIICPNLAKIHTKSLKLKEVYCWLPQIAATWNDIELDLARLIMASQSVRYFLSSALYPTGLMILYNPDPQILTLKLNN